MFCLQDVNVEIASPSDSFISPTLSIFLFIFAVLGALGYYVFNENQKRATVAAARGVRPCTTQRPLLPLCLLVGLPTPAVA